MNWGLLLLLAVGVLLAEGKFLRRKHWARCIDQTEPCPNLAEPACGRNRKGELVDFQNSCLACRHSQILFVRIGSCNSQ